MPFLCTRRSFLNAGIVGATTAFCATGARADNRPNILFIAADDLNDWIGCMGGHPQVRTPNLDRLARRGMLFLDAHAASPVCGPSRAALLSGLAAHRTDCYGNDDNFYASRANSELELLPQYFARHGYRTFGAGKIIHGDLSKDPDAFQEIGPGVNKWSPITPAESKIGSEELDADTPWVQHRVPRLDATLPLNRMPRDRDPRSSTIESFDWGPFDVEDDQMSDTVMTDWGIEVLRKKHEAPFFLGLGYGRPHQPLFAPSKYFDLYPAESVKLPEVPQQDFDDLDAVARDFGRRALTSGLHSTVVEHSQWRNAVSAYLACITYVDTQVGRVLDALDASPYADSTLIVFWGDNGWHLGEKEHWGKFTGWTRATRIPLIIAPPRGAAPTGFAPGRACDQPVSLLDLYPTLVGLAGLPPKTGLDGDSFAGLLGNPAGEWRASAVSVFGRGNHSVRIPGWRYIRYYDGTEELYDTQADPQEWRNLADSPEYASVKARAARFIPPMAEVAHYVRMGKWKAVLPAGEAKPLLYDLESENYVAESRNVADDHPEVLDRMRRYIRENGITAQYLAIPDDSV